MADELPNLTVEILKQIRDELRVANQRLSSLEATTSERLSSLEGEARSTNQRLERVEGVLLRMAKVNDAVLDEQLKDTTRLEASSYG
jgi:hypothetical protein